MRAPRYVLVLLIPLSGSCASAPGSTLNPMTSNEHTRLIQVPRCPLHSVHVTLVVDGVQMEQQLPALVLDCDNAVIKHRMRVQQMKKDSAWMSPHSRTPYGR